jgi:hypothetical protein
MRSCSIEKTGKHVGLSSWNQVHSPMVSNVQITALKIQSTGPNPQQQRQRLFQMRIACVFTGSTDPKQTTIKNIRKLLQSTLACA